MTLFIYLIVLLSIIITVTIPLIIIEIYFSFSRLLTKKFLFSGEQEKEIFQGGPIEISEHLFLADTEDFKKIKYSGIRISDTQEFKKIIHYCDENKTTVFIDYVKIKSGMIYNLNDLPKSIEIINYTFSPITLYIK